MNDFPNRAVHDILRRSTTAAHKRIDAIVGGGLPTRAAYGSYLRGMHHFVSTSQSMLSGVDCDLATRRDWLGDDLSFLGLTPLPMTSPGTSSEDSNGHAPVALGWEYVVAGSSVGARYLLRHAQSLGFSIDGGARFLAGHAAGSDWERFLSRLRETQFFPLEIQRLCDSALAAFAAAERSFLAAFLPDEQETFLRE